MRTKLLLTLAGSVLLSTLLMGGCPAQTGTSTDTTRDPFLTYAEVFGLGTVTSAGSSAGSGGASPPGSLSAPVFRQNATLTLQNVAAEQTLQTWFIAWVELGSLTNDDQRTALLAGGYVPLQNRLVIGSVFDLPAGTYIYNGRRTDAATRVRLGPVDSGSSIQEFEFITPDAILVFNAPPESCDSVAFTYELNGTILPGPSVTFGGYKTLAQVSAYQCDPLRPGLFYRATGGTLETNEFVEGSSITYTFSPAPDANGNFADVNISN